MRILDRYILRELLIPFLLGIGIFTSILLILRILKLVEMVVSRGVPLLQVLKLFSYILPAFLEVTVPMALLLAVLIAFGRLSADSEVTALHASGVSLYRLAIPVMLFATAVAALTLALSLFVRPWGNALLKTGLYEIVKARATAGVKAKVFNDDFDHLVIYVDRIESPGNNLQGILISDTREPRLHNAIYARFGIVVTDEASHTLTLRLIDGGIYTTTRQRKGYQTTRFSTYDINLDLNVALEGLHKEKKADEMTFTELRRTIRDRKAVGKSSLPERVELHRKFSIPFGCLVFAAVALPLGIRPSRSVHSRGFSVSVLLIFVYYLFLTLGQNLASRELLPPVVGLWMPNLLLSLLALELLRRAARHTLGQQGTNPLRRLLPGQTRPPAAAPRSE